MKEKLRKAAPMLSRSGQVLFKANLVSIPSSQASQSYTDSVSKRKTTTTKNLKFYIICF